MLRWVQYCFIGAISCWGPEVILAVLFRRSSADWEIAKAFLPVCTWGVDNHSPFCTRLRTGSLRRGVPLGGTTQRRLAVHLIGIETIFCRQVGKLKCQLFTTMSIVRS